ncbi:hypothetical protein AVEN_215227-1, partial [Araneus ventricosus]
MEQPLCALIGESSGRRLLKWCKSCLRVSDIQSSLTRSVLRQHRGVRREAVSHFRSHEAVQHTHLSISRVAPPHLRLDESVLPLLHGPGQHLQGDLQDHRQRPRRRRHPDQVPRHLVVHLPPRIWRESLRQAGRAVLPREQ